VNGFWGASEEEAVIVRRSPWVQRGYRIRQTGCLRVVFRGVAHKPEGRRSPAMFQYSAHGRE